MTTPHTPPAALLDVAAIEARAAAARPDPSHIVFVNGAPGIGIVDAAFIMAALDDIPALLAALRSLRAHVASEPERVAVAVAVDRARARRCTLYSERFDGYDVPDVLGSVRGMIESGTDDEVCEYCHDTGIDAETLKRCRHCECADAIAATGGR